MFIHRLVAEEIEFTILMSKKVRSYILKVVYRYVNVYSFLLYLYETFSVKLGHLLLFSSLVFPFIRLQNNSPIYHLTSCLLFIEVDKDVNTPLRFVGYI